MWHKEKKVGHNWTVGNKNILNKINKYEVNVSSTCYLYIIASYFSVSSLLVLLVGNMFSSLFVGA